MIQIAIDKHTLYKDAYLNVRSSFNENNCRFFPPKPVRDWFVQQREEKENHFHALSLKNPLRHKRHSNPNSFPKNLVKSRAHIPHTAREKLIQYHPSIDVNPCGNFERRELYWGFVFLLLRMQIVERDDDIYAPRVPNGSMSRAVHYSPLFCVDSFSRKSFSYNKLPQEPLRLSVLKLDGSSFGKLLFVFSPSFVNADDLRYVFVLACMCMC